MSIDLEPLVERRVGNTVKSQIGRLIDSKTKSTVEKILNDKVRGTEKGPEDFFEEDELEEVRFGGEVDEEDTGGMVAEGVVKTKDGKRMTEEEILKKIEDKDKFDIFTDIGDHWLAKGQVVRYQIDKNNRMLDRVDHPFSWEEIQKKYGAGNYKVIAKLPALNNQYLKSQTKLIASPPEESPEYVIKSLLEKKDTKEQTPAQTQGLSMTEIISLMERKAELAEIKAEEAKREAEARIAKAEERARLDAKERMELQKEMFEKVTASQKGSGDLIAQLTPLIATLAPLFIKKEPKDNTNVDMMMKMQEMNLKMFENMQKNTEKMIIGLQESIKSIAENNSKKGEDEFSAFKVMKMIKDSENEGFEKYRLMNELARERAEELAELRGESSGGESKDSTVDTLIKSFAPAIATMVAGGQPMPQPVQVQRPVVVQAPQQRGSVSQGQQGQGGQSRGANSQGVGRTQVQTTKETTGQKVHSNGQAGVQPSQKPALEAPKTTKPKSFLNSDLEEDGTGETIATAVTPVEEFSGIVAEPAQKDTKNIETIYGIIFPLAVGSYFDETATMATTATNCIGELERNGIELATVVRDFDEETISAILAGTPVEYHELIKGLQIELIKQIKAR